MDENIAKGKDRFVVVEWPECQFFMGNRGAVHLAEDHNAYLKFGDSAYFVTLPYYLEVSGMKEPGNGEVYLAVSFPESQLFMEGHHQEIYLINDGHGAGKYGPAAYFIEERLYAKVMAGAEREIRGLSFPNLDIP
ncbi:MAG: hypothetical protein H6577_09985 [Lewinellaceae bacterium]|nr:hypothetical protein [Saprospiraceae bacterium]MCB9338446.1 hypothetical protein [Lewinellaceae bacterium]